MGDVNKHICRLCLGVVPDGKCEVIEDVEKHILEVLLINMDFNISDNPVACKRCLEKLEECFYFKSRNTSFVNVDIKVGIKKEFQKEMTSNDDVCVEISQACRVCMSFIQGKGFSCTTDLEDMIGNCLPEVDLKAIPEPLLCELCLKSVKELNEFMKTCDEVEQRIKGYCQVVGCGKVVLEKMLGIKNCDTLTEPIVIKKECSDIEFVDVSTMKCVKSEENATIQCEAIDVKVELDEVEKVQSDQIVDCDNTETNGPSKRKISASKEEKRLAKTFSCHECPYETDYRSNLVTHILRHKNTSEVEMQQCPLCPFKNKYKSVMARHHTTQHVMTIKMYKCDECSYSTKHRKNFMCHQSKHKKPQEIQDQFRCEKCRFRAVTHLELANHKIVHSDKRPYSCDKCSYSSNDYSLLRRHRRVHQQDDERQMYKCVLCSYQAKTNNSIKYHMTKAHTDPSEVAKLKCAHCPYETTIKHCLLQHIRRQHSSKDEPMHKCALCFYMTKDKGNLQRHLVVHQKAMFKCDHCDFQTRYKCNLRAHMYQHNPNQPMLKCDQCDFQTKYKYSLRTHMSQHGPSDQRRFKCDQCEYYTWDKSLLCRHQVTHTIEETTMYQCATCNFKTKYKDSLKRHIKTCLKKERLQRNADK